jgi:hypothetical protein
VPPQRSNLLQFGRFHNAQKKPRRAVLIPQGVAAPWSPAPRTTYRHADPGCLFDLALSPAPEPTDVRTQRNPSAIFRVLRRFPLKFHTTGAQPTENHAACLSGGESFLRVTA